jgi:hypothetical protein
MIYRGTIGVTRIVEILGQRLGAYQEVGFNFSATDQQDAINQYYRALNYFTQTTPPYEKLAKTRLEEVEILPISKEGIIADSVVKDVIFDHEPFSKDERKHSKEEGGDEQPINIPGYSSN